MSFKRSIQLSMIAFSLVTLLQPAFSQGMMMATPAERAKRLKERLTLTDEQTKKVEDIFKSAEKERQDAMGSAMGDRDAMREQMTVLMTKTDKEIEKVLNDEQKKKYEELKKERRQMRRGPQGRERRETTKKDSAGNE